MVTSDDCTDELETKAGVLGVLGILGVSGVKGVLTHLRFVFLF